MNNTKIMDFLSKKISDKKYIIIALVFLCLIIILIPTDKREEVKIQEKENETFFNKIHVKLFIIL